MSDCVHTLSRIGYEWIRMNFLRWFSVFLLVPYSIISALLLILHSCISYVLSYQYTVFLGPIQKVQQSGLVYQYLWFSFKIVLLSVNKRGQKYGELLVISIVTNTNNNYLCFIIVIVLISYQTNFSHCVTFEWGTKLDTVWTSQREWRWKRNRGSVPWSKQVFAKGL